MKKTHSEPDVVYEEGDVTSMPYPNGAFDIVVDKGTKITLFFFCLTKQIQTKFVLTSTTGLIDSILSSDGSMDLMQMFSEINRVLKPNGLFIVITPKQEREYYFRRFGWAYDHFEFDRKQEYNISRSPDNKYYLFVVKRNGLKQTAS